MILEPNLLSHIKDEKGWKELCTIPNHQLVGCLHLATYGGPIDMVYSCTKVDGLLQSSLNNVAF